MKRSEAIKKIRETENAIEVQRIEKIRQLEAELDLENQESNRNRSRSIMVGTSFGGTTEISMRGNGEKFLYCQMQPAEVLELIHQLAANVGCHIAIKPREDFGSWREWRVSDSEKKHLNGHAPFANDMAVFQRLGALGFNQEEAESTMKEWLSQKEYEYVNGGAQIKKEQANEKVATFDQKKFIDDQIAHLLTTSLPMVAADNAKQTKAERQAWIEYRQKIQEIPLQPDYPNEVFWPPQPE